MANRKISDLTALTAPEMVQIGWVQDKLGGDEKVAEIEAALQAQLDEQDAFTKAAGLPWIEVLG